MSALQEVGQLSQPCLQLPRSGWGLPLQELPLPDRRGIRDCPEQREMSAGELGAEVVESPFITREKSQVGLDVFDGQLAGCMIGCQQRPVKLAVNQRDRIHLNLEPE